MSNNNISTEPAVESSPSRFSVAVANVAFTLLALGGCVSSVNAGSVHPVIEDVTEDIMPGDDSIDGVRLTLSESCTMGSHLEFSEGATAPLNFEPGVVRTYWTNTDGTKRTMFVLTYVNDDGRKVLETWLAAGLVDDGYCF